MKAPGRGLERGWEQYIWRNLFQAGTFRQI